ncbi:putative reverse transcriptase domain, reverse transcriptase zinc-binding domain protein [Tanacetum coccineum]
MIPSIPKSTAFFCNVLNHVKAAILNFMPFAEGELPVNYLGVPLISSRLLNKDCKVLVEKARNRIGDWKNKSLSYSGRLQLCKSVISSMQVYWASVLVIPMGIVSDIQQIIRGFLWCNGEYKRGKAKVAWDDICLPKKEGGLGLRSLEVFNLALMTTHIWNLVSNKESLWVRWINTYKLRGRTIWDVQPKANMSYGWRKLLQLREHVKPFFWSCIGNGMNTSLWYDTWSTHCPLSKLLSPRDITREGYSIHTCVADLIVNGAWNWPLSWLAKAPNLGLVPTPTLTASSQDRRKWRDTNGTMTDFTVKCAWEALRPRGNEAPWFHIVWFTHAIPRHAFQLWLIMRRSLKTQDKLRQWDVDPATDLTQVRCSLCGTQADSHEHLFFECSYSSKVWSLIRGLVGMDVVPPVLENIIAWFQPLANKRTVQNIVGKILIAAATYFIWLERNNRLFKRTRRSPEDLRDAIVITVRLKLVSFRFKNKEKVRNFLSLWKMPTAFRFYGKVV